MISFRDFRSLKSAENAGNDDLTEGSLRKLSAGAAAAFVARQHSKAKTLKSKVASTDDVAEKCDLIAEMLVAQMKTMNAFVGLIYLVTRKSR